MSTLRSDLQEKAQSALLQYAIFRWESALVIALTILLFFLRRRPFFWWPPFGWPLLGAIALGILIYSSLTDVNANARVLLRLYQEQFDPRQIKDDDLREDVVNALEYQRRIEVQVRSRREGLIQDRLEDTANQITDWISNIYKLALRLDRYTGDALVRRERESLPTEIDRLNAQLKLEANPQVRTQLESVIEGKGKHRQAIQALDARMKQASLQLEQSLTALATVYSQVQLIDAQGVTSGRAERLQADIREQVARLDDLVHSINEVYDFNTEGVG